VTGPAAAGPYTAQPIGQVCCAITEPTDDHWGDVVSSIELDGAVLPFEATAGLTEFSHIEVLFFCHLADPAQVTSGARHPRGNPAWPAVGILAQRGRDRPNHIAVTICQLLTVDHSAGLLTVRGLDAVDGTPVLDIKPWLAEFAPRGPVRQPTWSHELMAHYW
jgi:tRNA (adenine37-N6)-methyltransferase